MTFSPTILKITIVINDNLYRVIRETIYIIIGPETLRLAPVGSFCVFILNKIISGVKIYYRIVHVIFHKYT